MASESTGCGGLEGLGRKERENSYEAMSSYRMAAQDTKKNSREKLGMTGNQRETQAKRHFQRSWIIPVSLIYTHQEFICLETQGANAE